MNANNLQALQALQAKFGRLGAEAYEVDGELWIDAANDKTADTIHNFLSRELRLPFGSFAVQRSSNEPGNRISI